MLRNIGGRPGSAVCDFEIDQKQRAHGRLAKRDVNTLSQSERLEESRACGESRLALLVGDRGYTDIQEEASQASPKKGWCTR